MAGVCLFLGVGCLLYFGALVLTAGIRVSFGGIWLFLGACFLGIFKILKSPRLRQLALHLPKGIRLGGCLLLAVGLLCFFGAEGCILSGMTGEMQPGLDAVVVLGAQVRGTQVSRALAQRLRAAAGYLKENPNTYVIVSGGQGPGEDISEAEAMSLYLQKLGIAPERIVLEDRSVNTAQNLRYSFALLRDSQDSVGVVTNGFHVFRAVHIARAQGRDAMGMAAATDWWMLPHYMVREAFALWKDFLTGNAVWKVQTG